MVEYHVYFARDWSHRNGSRRIRSFFFRMLIRHDRQLPTINAIWFVWRVDSNQNVNTRMLPVHRLANFLVLFLRNIINTARSHTKQTDKFHDCTRIHTHAYAHAHAAADMQFAAVLHIQTRRHANIIYAVMRCSVSDVIRRQHMYVEHVVLCYATENEFCLSMFTPHISDGRQADASRLHWHGRASDACAWKRCVHRTYIWMRNDANAGAATKTKRSNAE